MDKTPDELNAEITRLQELLNGAQARGRETKEDADRKGEAEGAQATAAEQGGAADAGGQGVDARRTGTVAEDGGGSKRRKRRAAGQDKPTEDAGIYQAGEGVQAGEPRAADAGSDAALIDDSTRPRGPDAAALPIDGETTERGESEAIQLGDTPVAHTQQSAGGNMVESNGRSIAHTRTTDIANRMPFVVALCERMVEGESLAKACKDPAMPSVGTFLRWCAEDAEIGQLYQQALRIRAAHHAELLHEDIDRLYRVTSSEEASALKTAINTRQWMMSRLLPKMYGEKIEHEHTGEVKLDEKQIDDRLKHLVGRIQGLQPKA